MPERTEYDIPAVSAFADFMYGSLRFSEIASDDLARATKGNAWQIDQNEAVINKDKDKDKVQGGHFLDAPFTYTVNELSIRTAKAMMRYAKAFAWLKGKEEVGLDDLKTMLPYLLWHKLQPTEKAFVENTKYANDRIAFVQDLVTKIESDYTEMQGSQAWKNYGAGMQGLRTGKAGEKTLNEDDMRRFVKNAVAKIGEIDKPWAIMLASHIASEYNRRYNGK